MSISRPGDIAGFVLSRRQPSGGYSFARNAPPTLEDTYHAARILRFLERDPADQLLRAYVLTVPLVAGLGWESMFQLAHLLSELGEEAALRNLAEHARAKASPARTLGGLYHREALGRLLGGVGDQEALRRELEALPPARSKLLRDRFFFLSLGQGCGLPVRVLAHAAYLRQAQNGDGGFGFYPVTSSFLENCWHALRGLALLGAAPADPPACRAFVLRCQSRNGGFGRQTHAVPALDATWQALECLRLLGSSTGAHS